ncbi:fructosamine kinase family protein [Aureisphaera galaxeae]|uniref:fructosamine kinase family protein n=1 Tax=Aureisphaera galaxeae TaxID=1538023 RepID=UPI002350B562|nr:fructosamine kinase family protein [Aureisphaera galaxeae]MDC8003346.1 fructosamine kinase family protein [Aureisphaera galaxeae]
MNAFFEHIGSILQTPILNTSPLVGGDINEVLLLSTPNDKFVLKRNANSNLIGLFEKEAKGLKLLAQSNSFRTPKVIHEGAFQGMAFLLLEYVPSGSATPSFWESFAQNLVSLHRSTNSKFGLDHNNYIGSLAQHNHWCETSSEFYVTQRLAPQLKMAQEKGYVFPSLDRFFKNIADIIPKEPASLIHGDLWNGNFLIDVTNRPVLIDPAVAYAPREMDLAMMQLFGGFPRKVFEIYDEAFPLPLEWESRISLWQLYYILVHLNLFGSGYLSQTQEIISRYS